MSWEEIPGWVDEHLLKVYDQAIAEAKPGDVFVEIGVAFGKSAAYATRKIIDSGKTIHFWAVDPWAADQKWTEPELQALIDKHASLGAPQVSGFYKAFIGCMREHAPEELKRISMLQQKSAAAAGVIGAADFVFIDGDHSYEAVRSDIADWREKARVMAGHDHTPGHPGVERAVREAFGDDYEVIGSCWRKRLKP